jgi:hypothetical protein
MDDPARSLNHSARRINRLAEMAGAHRYLEIGVQGQLAQPVGVQDLDLAVDGQPRAGPVPGVS